MPARSTGSACATASGRYLDGGKQYKLSVPLPVPGKLFWSVTVYDADTRSQIQTAQQKAALRSLFELKDVTGSIRRVCSSDRREPAGGANRWIQTLPGRGLVRLLPHLRTGERRIRRQLETR